MSSSSSSPTSFPSEIITTYTELVVRDYLQSKGYLTALDSLAEDIRHEAALRQQQQQESEQQQQSRASPTTPSDGENEDYPPSLTGNPQPHGRAPPSDAISPVEAWYKVNQQLSLPTLLNENRLDERKRYTSILEVLLSSMSSPPPPASQHESHPSQTPSSSYSDGGGEVDIFPHAGSSIVRPSTAPAPNTPPYAFPSAVKERML